MTEKCVANCYATPAIADPGHESLLISIEYWLELNVDNVGWMWPAAGKC